LRHYQQAAIQAVESRDRPGQREMLLAMATGTGKTKTCIALIYRLLKAQRFRRVLFLVDRSALGEQAANAFKDTRMESLQTFAEVFGIKELDEQARQRHRGAHRHRAGHGAARALPAEDITPPAVDQYDCIVVDECHRGYLLDRELSDTELGFRSFDDYISKYRRVLDYFDAVKIGLTATPALHTTQIFGAPIYTYGYREAVIDGYLVDHEPPIQINTELSTNGIVWSAGERSRSTTRAATRSTSSPHPTRSSSSRGLQPQGHHRALQSRGLRVPGAGTRPGVTTEDADLLRQRRPRRPRRALLKKAFADQYGSVDDDAVIKITGAADKPLQLIRRYRTSATPTSPSPSTCSRPASTCPRSATSSSCAG
jgi:type I restriction enzyme R subunit